MTAFPLAPAEPSSPPQALPEPLAGLVFGPERAQDAGAVDALIDRAFGPGRFAKTAERLREGNRPSPGLSVCAWDGPQLVGAARQWPVTVGDATLLFLGPFAVDERWRSRGLGAALIRQACERARAAVERGVLLVGGPDYFGPLGFMPVPAGRIALPGPVDPRRVLWRPCRPGGLEDVAGPVGVPRAW